MRFFKRFEPKSDYNKKLAKFIKNIFGFKPENIFLFELAFLHKSRAIITTNGIRKSNERLEYLGDAILSAIIADYLFKKYPYKEEGFLTEMRAKVVSRENLNKLSKKLGFADLIIVDNHSSSFNKSVEGDAFEAFIGAMYLDKGFEFTKKTIVNRIINCYLDIDELLHTEYNFKSKIIEWAQKEKQEIEFKVVEEIGNGYNKYYVVDLLINNKKAGSGKDHSIKKAEQNAAEQAFLNLDFFDHTAAEKF